MAAAMLLASPALAGSYVYVSNAQSGTLSRYSLDQQSGGLRLLGTTVAAKGDANGGQCGSQAPVQCGAQ